MTMGAQIVFGLLLVVGLMATLAMASEFLEAYLWQRRLLFVFAPGVDDPALGRQLADFANHAGDAVERDLSLVAVMGDRPVKVDGLEVREVSAELVRARYGVTAGEFRAVLVGKDGAVKLSSPAPLAMEDLIATIDAMPMRRQELQEQAH